MHSSDLLENYYMFSEAASARVRELSFAGIALIWIFKAADGGVTTVPQELLLPAALFACALGCDLLQATLGALLWGALHRHYEKTVDEDADIKVSSYVNWPGLALFWGKIACVLAGYVLVIRYVYVLIAVK